MNVRSQINLHVGFLFLNFKSEFFPSELKKPNKPRRDNPTSLSVSTILPDCNLNPVIGVRHSFTRFRCLRRWTNDLGDFSEIACELLTGRTHQIRVHLAHLGFPIVGDKIYGTEESRFLQFIESGWTEELRRDLILPRQALHAVRLKIPWQREFREWHCPLSPDLVHFSQALF